MNKTNDLEEIQKEVELVKAKIRSNRKHILESNRISKDTIIHNKKLSKDPNLFLQNNDSSLSPFKLSRPSELKMPD